MFDQTTEYALRAMVFLARSYPRSQTAQQVATGTSVPPKYMAKVLQILAKHQLVRAQRGLHGGFMLLQEPIAISMLDVVNAIRPLERIKKCPLGLTGHEKLCSLHRRLDQTIASIEETFGNTSLEQLLRESTSATPLCSSQSPSDPDHSSSAAQDLSISAKPSSPPSSSDTH